MTESVVRLASTDTDITDTCAMDLVLRRQAKVGQKQDPTRDPAML